MAKGKDNYERVEATFAKDNSFEMDLFKFLLKQSKIIGKGKYIKNLIYEDMKKSQEEPTEK